MTSYIPENNYLLTNYTPIKKLDGDMCKRCEDYYALLYEKKLTSSPFPPKCEKQANKKVDLLDVSDFESLDEYIETAILLDPIAWAHSEFGWSPRFYQKEMLSCTSVKKLYRLGRRTGKTEAMVVEALYNLATNKDFTILVVAPYERQVTRFFDELSKFVNKSASLKGSLARYTKTPSRMDFQNGSKVLGFSVGADVGSGSDKVRGQDANLIIIDEIDTIEDADIDAVMAILASHRDCKLIAATTPRGWRRKFYTYVTNKNLGYKEFWFISAESPEWTEETEKYFKGSSDGATYGHEYLADFAELEDGVFKTKHIDASIDDYSIEATGPRPSCDYIMGVDWNKNAGVHIIILEKDSNKLKLIRKIIVEESQYTQTSGVNYIIELNRSWRPKWIFVDKGYGEVQEELLRKHSIKDPGSMLDVKLVALSMQQHIDIIDPLTGLPSKKGAKHFLVEQTKRLLDNGNLILPRSEDTSVKSNDERMGLVQQMRNFRVESYSIYGLPKYSQGQDHTLTAYYLACGGYYWKEGELKPQGYSTSVVGIEVGDEGPKPEATLTEIERQQQAQSGWKMINHTGGKKPVKDIKSRDLGNPSKKGMQHLKGNLDARNSLDLNRRGRGDIGYKRGKF